MKILIIDDDAGLRKSLTLILADAGYDVVRYTEHLPDAVGPCCP